MKKKYMKDMKRKARAWIHIGIPTMVISGGRRQQNGMWRGTRDYA